MRNWHADGGHWFATCAWGAGDYAPAFAFASLSAWSLALSMHVLPWLALPIRSHKPYHRPGELIVTERPGKAHINDQVPT